MSPIPVLAVAIALSVAAATITTWWLRADQPPATTPAGVSAADLAQLQQRITELTNRVDAAAAPATAAAPRQDANTPTTTAVAARLRQIEQRLHLLEQQPPTAHASQTAPQATAAAVPTVDLTTRAATARNRVLDPTTSLAQKVEAWGQLRHLENSWDDATVHEIVRIGLTAEDAALRADVWRQASSRQRHDALVPALLQALQSDRHNKAREEAAETLEDYLERPGVVQALQFASERDADEGVRRQAGQSLEQGQRERR